MSNDNINCHIKRSDRPCLVCSGHMDLIEAQPNRFSLFSGLPYICSSEGVDCLDCPKCGFKTTTADYQYLHMCKKERQSFTEKSERSSSRKRENSERRSSSRSRNGSGSRSRSKGTCPHCQAMLESSSWQFCPSCGNKCCSLSPSSEITSEQRQSNSCEFKEIETDSKSKNTNTTTGNTIEDTISTHSCSSGSNHSNSPDSGIARMVTPPNRTSIDDYSSPVQMQY